VLSNNYNIKDLINTHLASETNFLRTQLKQSITDLNLNRIKQNEYESNVCNILEKLEKCTEVNIKN